MPVWVLCTSTHSADGSRLSRHGTIPSDFEYTETAGSPGGSGAASAAELSSKQVPEKQSGSMRPGTPTVDRQASAGEPSAAALPQQHYRPAGCLGVFDEPPFHAVDQLRGAADIPSDARGHRHVAAITQPGGGEGEACGED
jgi:hypothetical protein